MEIKKIVSQHLSSNVFIVKKGNESLIIDAGAELDQIKNTIGKSKVLGVFLTHGHYDHALHALEYANCFDCKIYASEEAASELADPAKNYGQTFAITNFDDFVFLKGDGILNFGEFDVQYISTLGHCKSCLCFIVKDQLFAGDTLFENGIGRTDLLGSSKADMIASLEKLDNLLFAICHSGHGESSEYARQKRNIKAFSRFLKR